jgi:hypothetical protein
LATAAVFRGGDNPLPTGDNSNDENNKICHTLLCLLSIDGIEELLKRHKIDPDTIRKCVEKYCQSRGQSELEQVAISNIDLTVIRNAIAILKKSDIDN